MIHTLRTDAQTGEKHPYTPGPVINSRSDIVTQRRKSRIKMRWPEVAEVRGVHVL